MSRVEVTVRVEADDRIVVDLPRPVGDPAFPDLVVPWQVHVGHRVQLVFADEAQLVELRDAITAALEGVQ